MNEEQCEKASNAYLMSLIVFMSFLPIPILNLIGNGIYYLIQRKQSYAVRWHSANSFFSQIPLFFLNSFTWYLGWNLFWGDIKFNNYIIAYFIVACLLNIGEIVLSIIFCIRARKGEDVYCHIISPLTHILLRKEGWNKWEQKWVPAEQRFFDMAEKAKKSIVKELCGVGIAFAVTFVAAFGMEKAKVFDVPDFSVENGIADLMYNAMIKGNVTKEKQMGEKVNKIMDNLIAKNGMDSVNVYLLEDETINAFAYCGRNIGVFSGIIAKCETEEELTAILGHELSHVENRDPINGIKHSIGLSIIFYSAGDMAGIAKTLMDNKYSRDQERAADRNAVKYMYNAGINPEGFTKSMKMLLEYSTQIPDFLSDHPDTQARIDDGEKQIAQLEKKTYTTVLTKQEWEELRDYCKNLHKEKDEKKEKEDKE